LADFAEFAAMNEVYAHGFGQLGRRVRPSARPLCPRGARVEIGCNRVRR